MTENRYNPESYSCEIREDGPCDREATHVLREPYTSKSFPIRACGEHAEDLSKFDYRIDYQATHSLKERIRHG